MFLATKQNDRRAINYYETVYANHLVGDAAFCPSLRVGQGSALAMVSAYVLAGELGKTGGRHEEAFSQFEGLLQSYIMAKQKGAARLAFAPRSSWSLLLRNQLIKIASIQGLAILSFGRDIVDTIKLPDYNWPR